MNSSLIHYFQKIDLFGKHFKFEQNSNQNFTTNLGIGLSILIIITSIVICFIFGQELYLRQNPTVISSQQIVPTSEVSLNNFPIEFYVIDRFGIRIPRSDVKMLFDISYYYYEIDSNGKVKALDIYEASSTCNKTNYQSLEQLKLLNLNNETDSSIHCFDLKYPKLQNAYASPNSIFSTLVFTKCKSTNEKKCNEKIDEILTEVYFVASYIDKFVDTKNYSSPITHFAASYTQQLNKNYLKRTYLRISANELITDKGWLLSDYHEETYYSIGSFKDDINTINSNQDMYYLTIEAPNQTLKTTRSYMKFPELLAKIGGFYSFLLILSQFFIKNYVNFKYYLKIIGFNSKESSKAEIKKEEPSIFNFPIRNNYPVIEKLSSSSIPINHPCDKTNELRDNFKQFEKEKIFELDNFKHSNNMIKENVVRENNFIANDFLSQNLNLNQSNKFVSLVKELVADKNSYNYISYAWNDLVCCRNNYQKVFTEAERIMSIDNYIKLVKEFLNKEHHDSSNPNEAS